MSTPASLPTVVEWFTRASKTAAAQGRMDSANLWADGLHHLDELAKQREELVGALQPFVLTNSSADLIQITVRAEDIAHARAVLRRASGAAQ